MDKNFEQIQRKMKNVQKNGETIMAENDKEVWDEETEKEWNR